MIDTGDPIPDLPVVTIHGETARLPEIRGDGPAVIIPIRGPW